MTSPSRSITPIAALAASALLGGGVALAGAALLGAFDGSTTTIVQETVAQPATGVAHPASATSMLTPGQIYRRSASGVVQITTQSNGSGQTDQFGNQSGAQQALGSGFVLDTAGHIVTNYHVVQGAQQIQVSFSNQDPLKAKLVGVDPSTDLALLKVDVGALALTPLPVGNSENVQVGDPVVAIGNPFGLERTVTAGIVSALQRRVTAPNGFAIDHVIQTDAPINSGNSGGPLLNARGEVIGVNSQIETGGNGNGNVGIGFAVPANTVKSVIAQLLARGHVDHAYLGVSVREAGTSLAREFKLPQAGLLVESVSPASSAAKAGIRGGTRNVVVAGESYRMGGDLIVAAGTRRVTTIDALRDVIAAHKPGDKLTLKIYRGQTAKTVTVSLGRQPSSQAP